MKNKASTMIALNKKNAGKIPDYTTATEVARVFELDPRTVRKRIAELETKHTEGNNKFFDTAEILRFTLLNSPVMQDNVELDLTQERAKHYRTLTRKTEIEIEKLSDKYMLVEDVEENIKSKFMKFRQKLLIIPGKVAKEVLNETDLRNVKDTLRDAIEEALVELATGSEDDGI